MHVVSKWSTIPLPCLSYNASRDLTLDTQTSWYLCTSNGVAASFKRNRCLGVYMWKADDHVWVVKAESRLVARGVKQCEGIDFSETFAPTLPSSCMRLLSVCVNVTWICVILM